MAQDVVLTDAKPLKTSSQQARLTRLAEWAGGELSRTPTKAELMELGTKQEIANALRYLQKPEWPCRPERLIAHLRGLAVTHPMQELSEAEASLKFRIFCEDLGHVPERLIEEACRSYRRDPTNTFFPTPGRMLVLVEDGMKAIHARQRGAERAMQILELSDPQQSDFKGPYSVPEERIVALTEERKKELEAILCRVRGAPEEARPKAKPAEQEKLDRNGGLTPERREQLRELRAKLYRPAAA